MSVTDTVPKRGRDGRKKFKAVVHPCVPSMVSVWEAELQAAAEPSNSSKVPWGYFVPELGLIVSPTNEDRRKRGFLNWLQIRSEWRYILDDDKLRSLYAAAHWRTFLRTIATKDSKILEKFKEAWAVDAAEVLKNKATWHGVEVKEHMLDDSLCKEITWELSRLGFRYELLTVDSVIVRRKSISLDEAAQRLQWVNEVMGSTMMADTSGPPSTNTGLAATDVMERMKALHAFRKLMRSWPNVPAEIGDVDIPINNLAASEVLAIERAVARFYILTFVRHAARAPVLPHYVL